VTGAVRLGTRGSVLARTQSRLVAARLQQLTGTDVELVQIRTEGDRSTDSLASLGGTGVFVAAVRDAVRDGRCDVAVHSLKDLPTGEVADVVLAAVPPRADPRDALCARGGWTLESLPEGARVGTGSPRRIAALRAARPDLQVVDVRGNVDTRLARVTDGDLAAVVLARAGLERLGRLDAATEWLDPDVMAPAPGQGALAVECRPDLRTAAGLDLTAALHALDDLAARAETAAERTVLAVLEAGCSAPLGALGRLRADRLTLSAVVRSTDGRQQLRETGEATLSGDTKVDAMAAAVELGRDVAARLLASGAAELVSS
jgi:hydroxymethylbilane synthase